jgi:uncharacterized protein YjbJ (UPF0337 family)
MTTKNTKINSYGLAGRFRFKFGSLTANDLLFEVGKVDELLGRLRKRLGRAKEEIVDSFERSIGRDHPVFSRYEKVDPRGKYLLLAKQSISFAQP